MTSFTIPTEERRNANKHVNRKLINLVNFTDTLPNTLIYIYDIYFIAMKCEVQHVCLDKYHFKIKINCVAKKKLCNKFVIEYG